MTKKTGADSPQGFDPSAELWDRILDDIIEKGAPCIETVEKLVDESCRRPSGGGPKPREANKPSGVD